VNSIENNRYYTHFFDRSNVINNVQMARIAGKRALTDAGIPYNSVEQAVASYCYGDSTCGQRAIYELGLTGIPIYNVNNNCSSGSTALMMARQFIEGGIADCVMALGFEKMEKGSLGSKYQDRTNPLDKHVEVMNEVQGFAPAPPAAQVGFCFAFIECFKPGKKKNELTGIFTVIYLDVWWSRSGTPQEIWQQR